MCHQTVSLTARAIEAAGIPTVMMGCAKDIAEYVGAPRYLFSDFPLGNPAGRPHDPDSQFDTLKQAIDLLASATAPMTTVKNPLKWSDDPSWKEDISNVKKLSQEEIDRRREEFLRGKEIARKKREANAAE